MEVEKQTERKHSSKEQDWTLTVFMEDLREEKQQDLVTHILMNKSSSEGFLLQPVQDGLDPLYSLLSG